MSDALERVRMKGDPALNAIVDELIGCAWGRKVRAPDDNEPCPNQARTVIVVHDGDRQVDLKLCEKHRDRVMAETTPHAGEDDDAPRD